MLGKFLRKEVNFTEEILETRSFIFYRYEALYTNFTFKQSVSFLSHV